MATSKSLGLFGLFVCVSSALTGCPDDKNTPTKEPSAADTSGAEDKSGAPEEKKDGDKEEDEGGW